MQKEKGPLFTIATITYNSSAWVKWTIESVLASSFIDFEYIISDDFSQDNTWEIVSSYKDERIRRWKNEQNIGEYANRNKILFEAKGQYIFFIDGDDILYKDALSSLCNFLKEFKNAGMVWGVPVREIDFAVLPYEFSPSEIMRFIYFSFLPFSIMGLAETIFNTKQLQSIGGFSTEFIIGDTYVKRKLALTSNVILIPEGLSFWRRSENQASRRAGKNHLSFLDMHFINIEILKDPKLPFTEVERQSAIENIKISEIKLLLKNTILKGSLSDFFILYKKLNLRFSDFKYLFKKGNYDYKPIKDTSEPLMNHYNFIKNLGQ